MPRRSSRRVSSSRPPNAVTSQVTEKIVYTIPDKDVVIILYPDNERPVSLHVDYNSKVIGKPVRPPSTPATTMRVEKISPLPYAFVSSCTSSSR